MAKDLTKENLPLGANKEKKQLYKNWKLYAIALGIVTIGLSVGLGVGLGAGQHDSLVAKKDLNELGFKTTIALTPGTTISDVNQLFDHFLQNNQDVTSDLKNGKNIKISSHGLPSWGNSGWIEITGTGNYKGTLTINFPTWTQIDLDTFDISAIEGVIGMSQDDAFNAFLANNQDIKDWEENLDLSFVAPNYGKVGSLSIAAKLNTKYTGNIKVPINAIQQKALNTLNLDVSAIEGVMGMSQDDAFNAFLEKNNAVTDLASNVDLSFVAPNYDKVGSLAIIAKPNTKYTGTITITISRLGQIKLETLNLNTSAISGVENMTADDAFNVFIANNANIENISDLKNNIALAFIAPKYTTTGLLLIDATVDGQYSGNIKITINAIEQKKLLALDNLVTKLPWNGIFKNQDDAFDAFLSLNFEYPDLKDNVTAGLFLLGYGLDNGSLVIDATVDGKYSGNVTFHFNGLPQTNLSQLNTTIQGTETMTQDDAMQAFINENPNYLSLDTSLEINSFTAPTHDNSGSLTITAKPNTGYTGSVTVTINKIERISLEQLDFVDSFTFQRWITDQNDIFDQFIKLNENLYPELRNNVEIGSLTVPTTDSVGSLTINAKADGKYTGSVIFTFSGQIQTNLNTLNTSAINGNENMTADDAFNAFLANNAITDLKDNVDLRFTTPTADSTGSLVITAKPNTKYNGTITITINKLFTAKNLNHLGLNKRLNDVYIIQEKAFQAFLNANSNISDLKDNVEITSFINSKYDQSGSLVITGKGNYTGSVTIELGKISLPLVLDQFNGYDAGKILVNGTSDSDIKNAIVQTIVDLAAPPVGAGIINSFINISLNSNRTAATITSSFLGSLTGQIKGKATIYFTVAN